MLKQPGHCIESLLSRIQLRRDGIYNIPRLYFSVDTGKESRMHCESKNYDFEPNTGSKDVTPQNVTIDAKCNISAKCNINPKCNSF